MIGSVKSFAAAKYQGLIDSLTERTATLEFEKACNSIAIDILQDCEGFKSVKQGPDFNGTPFDFFGFKDRKPYIIELKASLKSFNTPGEVQKRRIKEVLSAVDGLGIALLQLKLREGKYRILYDDEMNRLFEAREVTIAPIVDWVQQQMDRQGK